MTISPVQRFLINSSVETGMLMKRKTGGRELEQVKACFYHQLSDRTVRVLKTRKKDIESEPVKYRKKSSTTIMS